MKMMLGFLLDRLPAIKHPAGLKATAPSPIIFKKLRRFIVTSSFTRLPFQPFHKTTKCAVDLQLVALPLNTVMISVDIW
jgi:hypothetical protein